MKFFEADVFLAAGRMVFLLVDANILFSLVRTPVAIFFDGDVGLATFGGALLLSTVPSAVREVNLSFYLDLLVVSSGGVVSVRRRKDADGNRHAEIEIQGAGDSS